MYYKDIETDRSDKKSHDEANRRRAGDRALNRVAYNKAHPKKEKQ